MAPICGPCLMSHMGLLIEPKETPQEFWPALPFWRHSDRPPQTKLGCDPPGPPWYSEHKRPLLNHSPNPLQHILNSLAAMSVLCCCTHRSGWVAAEVHPVQAIRRRPFVLWVLCRVVLAFHSSFRRAEGQQPATAQQRQQPATAQQPNGICRSFICIRHNLKITSLLSFFH